MPRKQPAKKADPNKELLDIVTQGFAKTNETLEALNSRITELEDERVIKEPETVSKPATAQLEPSKSYVPADYPKAVNDILGPDFEFTVELIGDQEMAVITVPDKYRPKGEIDAYISHWKSKRVDYQLTLENQKYTPEEVAKRMAKYDEEHKEPVVPKDQRSKVMSVFKDVSDFRKWLVLVSNNIKQSVATAEKKPETPVRSLQEELDK